MKTKPLSEKTDDAIKKLQGLTANAGAKVSAAADEASRIAGDVSAQLEAAAKTGEHRLQETAAKAGHAIKEMATEVAHSAEETAQKVVHRVKEAGTSAQHRREERAARRGDPV